jgi:hypothetical protein
MQVPEKYKNLVGTKRLMRGGLFSLSKSLPLKEYNVLDIRFGSATIMSVKEIEEHGESSYEHPTFELLVKSDDMKKSRWTRGFPIREINLKDNQ